MMQKILDKLCGRPNQPPNPLGLHHGDIIRLKSGGPEMTVIGISFHGHICCNWFDGLALHSARFVPSAVEANKMPTDKPSEFRQNP